MLAADCFLEYERNTLRLIRESMTTPIPLHQRYLSATNLPWPTNWSELFEVERPLIVEIGFGNADFLVHLAKTHPDFNVIGLEISNESLQKAASKIKTNRLTNVCAVHARAETALAHLFVPASIHTFYINYPDPWFKKRHSERRLMQRDTLDALVSRLIPGGWLYLATDVMDYAEMSAELLAETPTLTNQFDTPWVDSMPGRITTKYEARGIREGNPGKFFLYRRNNVPVIHPPVLKELDMPHVILTSPQTPLEMANQFERTTYNVGEGIHVNVLNIFHNPQHDSLLFETLIVEPTIEQHIALLLTPRETQGEYTLRYSTLGVPRITEGVHRATQLLGEWVASLHPESKILSLRVREE